MINGKDLQIRFQPNICFRFRILTCDPEWTGFLGLKKKAVYMGCKRERTTSREGMGRFQIRFQTIMGSVNSIENAHCLIPLSLHRKVLLSNNFGFR